MDKYLFTSNGYKKKSSVLYGIRSVRKINIGKPKVEFVKDKGQFLFLLKDPSGKVIGGSWGSASSDYDQLIEGLTYSKVKDLT